jgi:hypothetical protein
MDLQLIARAMTGDIQPDDVGGELAKSPRRKAMRVGFATLWGGLMLALLLVISGEAVWNLNRTLGTLLNELSPLGALVMMLGVGVMIYSRFLPGTPGLSHPSRDRGRLPNPPQVMLPPDSIRQPVSSVTESTTKLFEEKPSAPPTDVPRRE